MKSFTTGLARQLGKRRRLLRRIASKRLPVAANPLTLPATLVVALWFGLITGLLELLFVVLRQQFVDKAALGALQLNRHAVWMIPAAAVMVLGTLGVILSGARLLRLPWHRTITVYSLCFVSVITVLLTFRGLSTLTYAILGGGITAQLARRMIVHPQGFRRIVLVSLPGLAAILVGLAGYQIIQEKVTEARVLAALPKPQRGAPNVLFIVLDTVRAESLSLYGYTRETSPNITRLSRKGVRFDRARTTASWTLPSHASMFTGRWPHELSTLINRPLDAVHPTLAEYLRDHGYATAGFIANTYFCNQWYGLGRGFVHYEDMGVTALEVLRSSGLGRRLVKWAGAMPRNRRSAYFLRKDAPTINQELLAWLDRRPADRPFLAFLNYYDAHDPYLTPVEPARGFGLRPSSRRDFAVLQDWHDSAKTNVKPRDVQLARDCYDDCIAYLDAQLGVLFEGLASRGLLEDTVIIVTSDHGEEFGERTRFGHGQSLHHEVTHVPLLIVAPARIPSDRVVGSLVSLRDLPATIVDMVGLGAGSPFPGRSLVRHWSHPGAVTEQDPEPLLAEILDHEDVPPSWRPPRSVTVGEMLYIRNSDGREELYNLADDPAETKDLVPSGTAQSDLERCRSELNRLVASAPAPTLTR